VLHRLQNFETPHWATPYRGPLAIHAAQKIVTDLEDVLQDLQREVLGRTR
jgi:hypothetical protein